MNLVQIERDILRARKTGDKELIKKHVESVNNRVKQIDYNMSRLLENRDITPNSKLYPFYNKQCEEYSSLTRLLRIAKATK